MEQIINHEVLPDNNKSEWSEFDNINFSLDFDNRSLICNSIRFQADVQVYSDITQTPKTRLPINKDCKIDPKVGGHAFISSINTVMSVGNVENLVEYPRLVKMKADAQHTADDMMNSQFVCEMRAPSDSISELNVLQKCPKIFGGGGAGTAVSSGPRVMDPDFSILPHMILNNVESDNKKLSYSKSGPIRISIILERNLGVLYGTDVDGNYGYSLSNCRLTFLSSDDLVDQPISMKSSICLKSSLQSAFNNISSNVPAICDAVSISFQAQSNEYLLGINNTQLEVPPSITQLSYLFSDSTNKYLTYQLKDQVSMIQRGLDSLNSNKSNSATLANIMNNKGFIVGLKWNELLDLSNNKFNIQLTSGITSLVPFIMYSYYHSSLTL